MEDIDNNNNDNNNEEEEVNALSLSDMLDLKEDDIPEEEIVKMIKIAQTKNEIKKDKNTEDLISKNIYCIECLDHPMVYYCENCEDNFCQICFEAQHRKGNRAKHTVKIIGEVVLRNSNNDNDNDNDDGTDEELENDEDFMKDDEEPDDYMLNFRERAKYIPVRLTLQERKHLRLVESMLSCSEYTTKIDSVIPSMSSNNSVNKAGSGLSAKRMYQQLQHICALFSGLAIAVDYKIGQQILKNRDYHVNEQFFKEILELGRRHKIMNPEKMRSEYGTLMYILQDACSNQNIELLKFSASKPIFTAFQKLKEGKAQNMLDDPLMEIATRAIMEDGKKSRYDIRMEVQKKEKAVKYLSKRYSTRKISPDDIKHCLYSIGDNNSFLVFNRDPIDKMIELLTSFFSPKKYEEKYSLSIFGGQDGSRLTHSHERQYHYCLQSLTLWREISNDMFRLWYLADQDLVDNKQDYRLKDTGQGCHRIQQSPRVAQAMREILHRVQKKVGQGSEWVGSSVVHLGDDNVPNALMFIDKYTQVPRILNPIVLTIKNLPGLLKNKGIKKYVDQAFGGPEELKKLILWDFFRHAFDGSGADNFFDAGSCIDGRLTSAWNWCSQLDTKPYYPIFKLSGFTGFDGSFN
eukprot:TRINITY_DN3077_c4_g2_i2.p1 TRINITY_DN3077_c4_g2~~TRINITY_DN3077_c4_g2_i2.p1  ORF type:complete len:632 (-),score=224.65 TRINITY_DN3077_c4_g2_i2:123-2018(-)